MSHTSVRKTTGSPSKNGLGVLNLKKVVNSINYQLLPPRYRLGRMDVNTNLINLLRKKG